MAIRAWAGCAWTKSPARIVPPAWEMVPASVGFTVRGVAFGHRGTHHRWVGGARPRISIRAIARQATESEQLPPLAIIYKLVVKCYTCVLRVGTVRHRSGTFFIWGRCRGRPSVAPR
jgi:hypothetical protein